MGNSGEVKRAFALSFFTTLWIATGLEDNGGGTNNLFYSESGTSWARQQEVAFFDGRLHGGVVFRNRLCLFLGDNIDTSSRWVETCAFLNQ